MMMSLPAGDGDDLVFFFDPVSIPDFEDGVETLTTELLADFCLGAFTDVVPETQTY